MAEDTGPPSGAANREGYTPPGRSPDAPGWVGVRAVAWAIDDAPVPAELALTLLVIARRADENGRGSRQSVATIASKTGKSEAQVRRDIARLRELRLLRLGDQSLVAHLPPGKRPVVYDLPLSLRGPKPAKESRNKSGKAASPSMDATPSTHATPSTDATPTPRMDAWGTPSTHATQTTQEKNPQKNPSLSVSVSDERPALVEDGERDEDSSQTQPQDLRHRIVAAHGATPDEIPRTIAAIEDEHQPRTLAWWRTVDHNGDAADIVAKALARIRARTEDADELDLGENRAVVVGMLIRKAEREEPACEHGTPAGRFLHPTFGKPLCPFCRRGLPPRKTREETMAS